MIHTSKNWRDKDMNAALALDEVFYTAWNTSKLDAHNHKGLQALLANGANAEERRIVNRLLYAVRRGWIEIIA